MADVTIIPAVGKCGEIVRTAVYARVSSDSTDQLNSFTAQIQYYSDLLKNSSDAVLVDIYADEGISGTGAEKRTEFQRLMRDCRKGKIGLIERELDQNLSQRVESNKIPQEHEESAESRLEAVSEEYTEEQSSADVSENFDNMNDEAENINEDQEQDENEYMGMGMSM